MSILWITQATTETMEPMATDLTSGFLVTGRLTHPAQLMAAYHQLGQRTGDPEPSVTVQVSSIDAMWREVAERTPGHIYRNITGTEGVVEAIIRCQQALCALHSGQTDPAELKLAVMVRPAMVL